MQTLKKRETEPRSGHRPHARHEPRVIHQKIRSRPRSSSTVPILAEISTVQHDPSGIVNRPDKLNQKLLEHDDTTDHLREGESDEGRTVCSVQVLLIGPFVESGA